MEGGKALSDKIGAEEVEQDDQKNFNNIKHHAVAALSPEDVAMEKR